MFRTLQPVVLRTLRPLSLRARTLATHAADLPSTSLEGAVKDEADAPVDSTPGVSTDSWKAERRQRPHLGIKVDENHGLWAFFRRKEEPNEKVTYEAFEAIDVAKDGSGRSWTAAELRRKSFKDLHTLWYVLLRERNLLATQVEDARRHNVHASMLSAYDNVRKCRKSMARIKYVINERRLAYEAKIKLYEQQREEAIIAAQEKEEAEKREAEAQAEAQAQEELAAQRGEASDPQSAARLAGAGLFETTPESPQSQSDSHGKES
ncbi:MRP-L47-domain-containing protein [Laetiporus sulphureus 93-53]|uniref:Large ribosomal subunit protein uL29m n=1 Tax=Laetiporus sulphureus 93-53 TaxID=1314785 RepID=A0A165HQZ7_9APHY|nr:MRP-L47-domain-containing protein [Laetiporus sulphureus 93-53]KZT12067.1 MRP-L47-domain-containing protein [Laetiporus sulphureus 93-53]